MTMSLLYRNGVALRCLSVRLGLPGTVLPQPHCRWRSIRNDRSNFYSTKDGVNSGQGTGEKVHIPSPPNPGQSRGPVTWRTLAITAVFLAVTVPVLQMVKKQKKAEMEKDKIKSMGKASIGGEFELIDQNSKPVSSKDFLGKWLLIYFGFTHCPDICPEELEKMSKVIQTLDANPDSSPLQPLFVSVDPERDTPQNIAKYLADFSPRMLGLTGTLDQIKEVCRKFRIYFSMGPKDSDEDYIVDHSIIMYLMDSKGEFVDYFGQNKSAEEISNVVLFHMSKEKALETVKK